MDTTEARTVALRAPARRHYIGADRRAVPARHGASNDRILVATLGLLLALWALLEIGLVRDAAYVQPLDTVGLSRLLDAAVVALGAVVALLGFVRWRLTGEARPLWLGAAALVFGPLAVGAGDLLPAVVAGRSDPGIIEIRLAGRAVAGMAMLAAALWPSVDTRLRPRYVSGGALAVAGLLALALSAVPVLEAVADSPASRIVLAVLWLAVAAAHVRAAKTSDTATHETIAVVAAALALGEILLSHIPSTDDPWMALAGAALIHTVGLVVLVGRGLRDLEVAFVTQRARLLETEIGMEAEAARRRAEQFAQEERAHDAKNALLAIEGAAVALERYRDRLAPERRAELVKAVSGEIARLQHLIAANPQDACEPFDVVELLGPVLAAERARGLVVDLVSPDHLPAVGRSAEIVEVVRNLLDNARRYAPGSPVTVRTAVDSGWAVVFVEDRGRGVARDERDSIFERGHRGRAADGTDGSGLGLFVSRRLMLDQGGDLWVENRVGGGASFGLCLPLMSDIATVPGPLSPAYDRRADQEARKSQTVGRHA